MLRLVGSTYSLDNDDLRPTCFIVQLTQILAYG